jgi:hypothetical protein
VGIPSFAAVRKEGSFYVDKTAMLGPIFKSIPQYVLFVRPPRFGKSQLLSTLQVFSDMHTSEDDFNKLFDGLAVMQDRQIVETCARKYAVLPLVSVAEVKWKREEEAAERSAVSGRQPRWAITFPLPPNLCPSRFLRQCPMWIPCVIHLWMTSTAN